MLRIEKKGRKMIVYLTGEIDHYSAEGIRYEIETALKDKAVTELILSFEDVGFMDSSGVGMLIGRYKTMKQRGGCVKTYGLSKPMDKLFRLAGLHRIMEVCSAEEEKVHA